MDNKYKGKWRRLPCIVIAMSLMRLFANMWLPIQTITLTNGTGSMSNLRKFAIMGERKLSKLPPSSKTWILCPFNWPQNLIVPTPFPTLKAFSDSDGCLLIYIDVGCCHQGLISEGFATKIKSLTKIYKTRGKKYSE